MMLKPKLPTRLPPGPRTSGASGDHSVAVESLPKLNRRWTGPEGLHAAAADEERSRKKLGEDEGGEHAEAETCGAVGFSRLAGRS